MAATPELPQGQLHGLPGLVSCSFKTLGRLLKLMYLGFFVYAALITMIPVAHRVGYASSVRTHGKCSVWTSARGLLSKCELLLTAVPGVHDLALIITIIRFQALR